MKVPGADALGHNTLSSFPDAVGCIELAGSVDCGEEMEPVVSCLSLDDSQIKEANAKALEALTFRFPASTLGKRARPCLVDRTDGALFIKGAGSTSMGR